MEVGILGHLELRHQGKVVALGGLKQRALLAVLASQANKVVSNDSLIELVWGEEAPETARHSLEVYVSQLRKLLEPGDGGRRENSILIRKPPGYMLQLGPEQLDLTRFQRLVEQARLEGAAADHEAASSSLTQALALWRGPAFAEFASLRLGLGEGARLNELRLRALEERVESDLQLGRHADLVGELEALLAQHPLRERLVAQLMLALYRSGRQAEASGVYQRTRERLVEDLGMEAGPELQVLLKRILTHDQSLDLLAMQAQITSNVRAPKLPSLLTQFIGRADDITQVTAWLDESRIVTLTGVGGVGKTRLAIRIAETVANKHADGVALVQLASLKEPELVAETIAHSVGLWERQGMTAREDLTSQLQERRLLLVLDNCEHLIAEVAHLAQHLLERCHGLTVLATSREPLGIGGERVWKVQPFRTPKARTPDDLAELSAYHAVNLFCDRAVNLLPTFELTVANASAVAVICQRMDGIPLAIELAASGINLLPVEEIARRLNDRFSLVSGGDRTALPRHKTLRATIDWSHGLLLPEEAMLFRRLSVFAGRFSLEAAEAVATDQALKSVEIVVLLGRLLDKSLITPLHQPRHAHFGMLETLGQYAGERLRESGEEARIREQLVEHYLQWTKIADDGLESSLEADWTSRSEIELENLRNAAEWSSSLHPDSRVELLTRIAHLVGRAGHIRDARSRIEDALAIAAPSSIERGWALCRAAAIAAIQGEPETADRYATEARSIGNQQRDAQCEIEALFEIGLAAYAIGDFERSRLHLDQGLAIARAADDTNGVCYLQNGLGEVCMRLGIWPDAAAHLTESLDLASELGVPTWIGDAANNLAVLCLETGDLQHAQEANAQAIAAYRPLQDHLKFAGCLETSARIAAKGEANEAALRFATAAESLWELEGTPPFPWLMSQLDRDLAGARDSLTHEQAERAIASARTMTLDEILLEATRPLRALGGEVDLPQTIVRSKVHDLDPPGISAKPFQAS